MLISYQNIALVNIPLVSESDIVTILLVVVFVFAILLILGVRKSYILKKENEKLNNMDTSFDDDDDEYKDFTDGHMYGNN